jgi:integrase
VLRAPASTTLREAAEAWLEGAREGTIRTRSGDPYKPSAIAGYDAALRLHLLDDLGAAKLADIGRADLQDLADRLLAKGLDPSTIRNALMPLRAIYRRALSRGEVAVNPTTGIELPAVRGKRDRIASPEEAARLIASLDEDDRAVWATAFYAGLRRGELMALRWEDIDLAGNVVRVERSYDREPSSSSPRSRGRASARCRSPACSASASSRTGSAPAARTGSCSATDGRRSMTGRYAAGQCGRGRLPGSTRSGCTSVGTRSRR